MNIINNIFSISLVSTETLSLCFCLIYRLSAPRPWYRFLHHFSYEVMDCLKKRKAVLGDTHPDTLNSMNNLARLYDLAEPLYKNCPEKLVDG